MSAERPSDAGTSPQRRVDRIRVFREELSAVEQELGPLLEPPARARLDEHHSAVLDRLKGAFDVDASEAERQLSLGMRVASLLGAFAFCAAVFFFFYRYWGRISTPTQVGLLVSGPLLGLAATEFAARRERTLYFALLAGLVTCASFVLALEALGRIFSLPTSPWRYLAWGGFCWTLAFAYGFRLVLAAAVVSLTVFLLGSATLLTGAWWASFFSRPEGMVLVGAAWVGMLAVRPSLLPPDFAATVRLTGASIAFIGLLTLGLNGNLSLVPLGRRVLESIYDAVALGAGAAGIGLGIRRGWAETRLVSTGFVILLLVVKAFDWWWEWLPRELFFLVLGLMAVGILVALRRLRARLA
ncbi:MAG TPA: hypothetical protein VGA78_17710 [Gemmatimonadales bacterium]